MTTRDFRDDAVTAATPVALEAFESALALFQSWRAGMNEPVERALLLAPDFTMAHVLAAHRHLTSRDPTRVMKAHAPYRRLRELHANRREQLHIDAIGATLADDYRGAKALLGALLAEYPRDVLALQVAHSFDYVTGDVEQMAARTSTFLDGWSSTLPGYAAVLAMHAFSLVEAGHYRSAERTVQSALSLDPGDGRAHHALAHVQEMSERPATGLRLLEESMPLWSTGTVVTTHLWWHQALFHLSSGDDASALSIYDRHIRIGRSHEVPDLIDASALLWRLMLAGVDVNDRWTELASAWAPRMRDAFCTFNDLHAMMAFVGAGDERAAEALQDELLSSLRTPTRYAETTRLVGLPACQGLAAFGQGHYGDAVERLGSVPQSMYRIGGSHAQRDVLYLTLMGGIERLRRPDSRRPRTTGVPSLGMPLQLVSANP
jgi:hypothetical protein